MNMLSLAALSVLDAGPVEQIKVAAAAGFEAVGLRLMPLEPSQTSLADDLPLRRELKRLLADTGLSVLDIEIFRLTPALDLSGLLPVFEMGAELGGKYVLLTGNDPDDKRAAENFARLCDAAEPFGLTAMLEFVPYRCVRTIEQAYRLIQAAARPNAGICVDALHLNRSGGCPESIRSLDPVLFPYMQICDARPVTPPPTDLDELAREARTDRLYPGEGGLALAELLHALPAGLPLSVEVPSRQHAHRSPMERAKLAAQTTRRFLESCHLR